ncbi:hypothetical protein X777_06120, partial [Ooceraea biroi]
LIKVKDVITSPPAERKFDEMKKALVQRLATSQQQCTRQLIEHEELGNRKPSQFLRHIKTLAAQAVPDSLVRTLWLGRLPAQMQVILATRQEDRLEDVAEQADWIHEVNYRAVAAVSHQSHEPELKVSPLEVQIRQLSKQVASLMRKREK